MESIELPSDIKTLIRDAKRLASTDWEKSFVKDLAERHKKWGDTLYMSEKQLAALRKIAGLDQEEDADPEAGESTEGENADQAEEEDTA